MAAFNKQPFFYTGLLKTGNRQFTDMLDDAVLHYRFLNLLNKAAEINKSSILDLRNILYGKTCVLGH